MKTICKLGLLFLAIAFTACQKGDIETKTVGDTTVTIADGWITSPRWLVEQLGSMARPNSSNVKTYPWVYSLKYKGNDYLFIWDPPSSDWERGNMFFTLSGEYIEMGLLSEQRAAMEGAKRETGVLLWSQP